MGTLSLHRRSSSSKIMTDQTLLETQNPLLTTTVLIPHLRARPLAKVKKFSPAASPKLAVLAKRTLRASISFSMMRSLRLGILGLEARKKATRMRRRMLQTSRKRRLIERSMIAVKTCHAIRWLQWRHLGKASSRSSRWDSILGMALSSSRRSSAQHKLWLVARLIVLHART